MISFSCPQCKTTYRLPDTRAGEQWTCSKCKYPIKIPPAGAAPETGPRPAAPPLPPKLPPSVVAPVAPAAPAAPVPPKRPTAPPPVPASVARPAPPPPITKPPAVPPAPPRPAPPSQARPAPAAPSAHHPPAVPHAAKRWYYEDGFDIVGPVPEKELRVAAENDLLFPDARVWSDEMDDWQPAIEAFPRLFDGLATKPKPDKQTKVAVVLAAVAVGSLLLFGVVYAVKGGKKGEAAKPEVAKNDAPAPAPAPAPPVVVPAPAPEPDVQLKPVQIMEKFGPSVARVATSSGSGSGFLARPNIVVTNAHVIDEALSTQLRVSFPSGPKPNEQLDATLLYEDSARDLAILEVRSELVPVKLASSAVKGEDVVVIGSPGTEPGKTAENSITRGILSAMNEEVFGQSFHRIDAAINPGNSGGPVFNDRGAVLGVATMYLRSKQQMNYIVPFADVATALDRVRNLAPSDAAALARKHDARVVATCLTVGVLINDRLQNRYVEKMVEASKRKQSHLPGVREVKQVLPEIQARVNLVAPPAVRDAARRLAGGGVGALDGPNRDDLLKLIALFDESQRLAADAEKIPPPTYVDRHQATNRQYNELVVSIPKNTGENKEQFDQRVGILFERVWK